MAPTPKYPIGTTVLCKYKDTPYEAKVIDIKDANSDDPAYVIHYHGWNSRHDEEVRFSISDKKLSDANEDALKTVRQAMSASKKKKSRMDNLTDDDARFSEAGSRGSSPSTSSVKAKGAKRKAEPSSSTQNSSLDYNITILKNLNQIMVDDHDLISKNYLPLLPARHTIESIINDYLTSINSDVPSANKMCDVFVEYDNGTCSTISNIGLIGSTSGLIDYFNALLEPKCLYKFERLQFHDFKKKMTGEMEKGNKKSKKQKGNESTVATKFQPSKYYGITHLLRLFQIMPSILRLTPLNANVHKELFRGLNDIVCFLNKNSSKYFNVNEDYYIADQEYCRSAYQA